MDGISRYGYLVLSLTSDFLVKMGRMGKSNLRARSRSPRFGFTLYYFIFCVLFLCVYLAGLRETVVVLMGSGCMYYGICPLGAHGA